MAHYKTMRDGAFLDYLDLQGKDALVQIESVEQGEMPIAGSKQKKRMPTVRLVGKSLPLGLNATNSKTIAKLYGVDTRDWVGKWITLYPTTTMMQGDRVGCIRIRPDAPKQAADGKDGGGK